MLTVCLMCARCANGVFDVCTVTGINMWGCMASMGVVVTFYTTLVRPVSVLRARLVRIVMVSGCVGWLVDWLWLF